MAALVATVLKLLFRVKPGVELFREKRLPTEQAFKNKLGYTLQSRVTVLKGVELDQTADLINLLDGEINSEIEALGYSDFILRWQNYFSDLPYCAVLHPFRKDLRAEEAAHEEEGRVKQLDALLHSKVHHAQVQKANGGFTIDRTLGIADNQSGQLTCSIWKVRESIQRNGSYKMEKLEKLFEEEVSGDDWNNLPRWFPRR